MGSPDPGGGQGLKLLECNKRRKNTGLHTACIDLLEKPTQGTGQGQISDVALFTKALLERNKMNLRALGLIQGKLNPALWPDYVDVGDAATFWTRLETKYRKAGGANTVKTYRVWCTVGKAPRSPEVNCDRDSVCED